LTGANCSRSCGRRRFWPPVLSFRPCSCRPGPRRCGGAILVPFRRVMPRRFPHGCCRGAIRRRSASRWSGRHVPVIRGRLCQALACWPCRSSCQTSLANLCCCWRRGCGWQRKTPWSWQPWNGDFFKRPRFTSTSMSPVSQHKFEVDFEVLPQPPPIFAVVIHDGVTEVPCQFPEHSNAVFVIVVFIHHLGHSTEG